VPDKTKPKAAIRWEGRALITLPIAAEVLSCSVGQIYNLGHRGEVDLVNLGGRTLARTHSIVRLAKRAPPRVSAKHRTAKALAGRTVRRRSAEQPDAAVTNDQRRDGRTGVFSDDQVLTALAISKHRGD
jgi:hypothetical protein